MINVFDRKTKCIYTEEEYGKETLEFLYNKVFGRMLLKLFVVNRFYSKLNAISEKTRLSSRKIESFITKYNIDMIEYNEKKYKSFNEFFTRKKKKCFLKIDEDKKALISPCDGKLQIFKIDDSLRLKVKGSTYRLEELLEDDTIVNRYRNGLCLVYRLSVDDYHRYCHIDSGQVLLNRCIKGKLHTVRPIAKRENVFKENQREYAVLNTDNIGEMIYMEVGALQIGKINNHKRNKFKKGQEKGFFSYGASTIVIIFPHNRVKIDEDILQMSRKNIETAVKYGEKVGGILC